MTYLVVMARLFPSAWLDLSALLRRVLPSGPVQRLTARVPALAGRSSSRALRRRAPCSSVDVASLDRATDATPAVAVAVIAADADPIGELLAASGFLVTEDVDALAGATSR